MAVGCAVVLAAARIGPHQVTYDVQREIRYGARVVVVVAAVPNWASSGHLRRCSDADTIA
eukprot:scaffold12357_cov91-Skeletonema_dohrnii-CCMP3373.AAC.9